MSEQGPRSTEHQVELAQRLLEGRDEPTFLFMNVSAIHQPNGHYLGQDEDDRESHAAALAYVDGALAPLFATFRARSRPTFCVVTSDHGTLYGEDGLRGHRINHPLVLTVPYAEFVLESA